MASTAALGKSRIGLVQFPGSNCDADCVDAFQRHFGIELALIWHTAHELPPLDGLILPGGFSYGDYLRGGALASHAPIMEAVRAYARKGGPIMGICNGFQILTESHLLPGVLLRNASRRFICKQVNLAIGAGDSTYHRHLKGGTYQVPIAHGEGRYFIDAQGLQRLQDEGQILFQYAEAAGRVAPEANPNGAVAGIAGIVSVNRKIMGMMPHPERATDLILGGSEAGRKILEAFLDTTH